MFHTVLSHARRNLVAYLALFVALGGTSYAAVRIPANSVTSKQIKPGAIAGSDIRANAITSSKVRNGALLAKDFKAGALPAGKDGAPGARGATGPAGAQGARGATGPAGSTGTARAYAAFGADGTISPTDGTNPVGGSALGLAQGDETAHTPATGVYCFHPSFVPQSAMVSAMGDLALASSSFVTATVSVRTNKGLSGCGPDDTVRVRMFVTSAAAPVLADEPFLLWLE